MTGKTVELPSETTARIRALCAEAYRSYDKSDYRKALRLFYQGWVLLPKLQTRYAEAGWVLTGIRDSYYRLKLYIPGSEALRSADHCPHTHGNPFIRLRLGQCLYQLGERASARTYLLQAHRLGGQDLFADAADQIYLDAIADLI